MSSLSKKTAASSKNRFLTLQYCQQWWITKHSTTYIPFKDLVAIIPTAGTRAKEGLAL
jgi:hypothetical protein